MAVSFVVAATLQAVICMLHGLLYFLSMPLVLALYSFVNLYVVEEAAASRG